MYSPFDYRFVNLATYRSVPRQDRSHYSFLILSEAGFYYLGNGDLIRCDSCGKINDFLSVEDKPHSATYHNEGCARVTTSTDESRQNNPAPEFRELLSTSNPTMYQQVQQNINNSTQDEIRQSNAASQSSELQSNSITHQNLVVAQSIDISLPVEVLRQRGTHIDGAQQGPTSTASGETKPNLDATETTESPQHHNTDAQYRDESINIGQESMTAQEESESSRKQQIRAMWSHDTHGITCRAPWPGYNVKCWKCHESIYIHEGMENISELARELREGRPILCSCAKRLRLLALLLALETSSSDV
uniref:Uncharacterized protein n=1 Tax=Biomphalaria glabrata TaxID=6526 RepID=A0A2C9KB54_BIOGL